MWLCRGSGDKYCVPETRLINRLDLMMKTNARWMALLLITMVLFYWKILLTRQFTLLGSDEIANQAYSWDHFSAATLQRGELPLWDPYTNAGRTFVGGMESGVFYPPKLLLYLWPLNRSGLFSPQLYHTFHVITHLAASVFLFLLARQLGLSGFSAFIASICFSLGGYVARISWPYMLDSTIWLPLIFLFLLRSLRASAPAPGIRFACLSGLAMGMAVLGGSIHVAIMDVLVVVGAAVYFAARETPEPGARPIWRAPWKRSAIAVAAIGATAFCFGAVQLLPSAEYSSRAVRYIAAPAPIPPTEKIPYDDLHEPFEPRALLSLLSPVVFPGGSIRGEGFSFYLGIAPLILVILGVWRNWDEPWVRYLASLAVLTFFFTLGPYSLLHGLAYALVPFLWMAREAARFVYIVHFAMAILAGFGVETLIFQRGAKKSIAGLAGVLKWVAIAMLIALGLPALYGSPTINEWIYFSFLLIITGCGLFLYLLRNPQSRGPRFVLTAFILFDFSAFYWGIQNKSHLQRSGDANHLERLFRCKNLAGFLTSQPGLFRVHLHMDNTPNIGDLYGVQTTASRAATELADYLQFRSKAPRALDLLNVRYIVQRSSSKDPSPVYSDPDWKVYQNPSALPRAWVVHQVETVTSSAQAIAHMKEPGFDPSRIAFIDGKPDLDLQPEPDSSQDRVDVDVFRGERMDLRAHTRAAGLLVVSEVDYPGWQATVNGQPARIHKTDGLLRGIAIPSGDSRIEMRYEPRSVYLGAALTILAPLGTLALFAVGRGKTLREREGR